jgi:iron complex transport system ATP-binding protein
LALRFIAKELVMLEARSLEAGFASRAVLREVSFSAGAGEVLGVLGPNGSGKTTLFRTLLGLLPARGGEVLLSGTPIAERSRNEMARLMAYVPQGHAAYFPFTLREFVLLGRSARHGAFASPGARDRAVAEAALDRLGIGALAGRAITEVSSGERQLALIARALAQEPRILVMDEPTASLDFGNQIRVLEALRALAGSGLSILFSTHDPDHAFLAARRVLLLGEGGLLAQGAPRDVIRADLLARLYGVTVEVLELEGGRHACVPALSA